MDRDNKVIFSPATGHNTAHEQHIDQVGALPGVTLPPASTKTSHGTKQRLKDIGRVAKSATKNVLHIDDTRGQIEHSPAALPHVIENDAGLNPSKELDVKVSTAQQIKNKLPKPHSAKELKDIILHPQAAWQDQAAEALAVSENPHLAQGENDKLINAHEELKDIEQSEGDDFAYENRATLLNENINKFEHDREEKRAAWVSSRYVHGARVLSAQQYKFPFLSSCRWVDGSGEPQGIRWSQWFNQLQDFTKQICEPRLQDRAVHGEPGIEKGGYDQDILLQEAERVIIASSSLQRWVSDLRKMRNWQNPRLTALWFTTWLCAWSCNRVFTFLYCYAAYRALQRRTHFDKRESLKDAHVRAANDDDANNSFSEIIGRFGSSKWLQPTLEAVGPVLQPMLRSTADWLEIIVNYPEWKTQRATWCIMTVLGGAILFSSLMTSEFCLRALTLALILIFFVDKPLLARYPMYRQVLLPLHWIFWDVPTSTETSFGYVRQQAQAIRQELESDKAIAQRDGNPAADIELFAAQCDWNDISGDIVLTSTDIYFMRKFPRQEMWRRGFEDIMELKKGEGQTSLLHKTEHIAELRFRDGTLERLLHLKMKDTLFNVIIAFSGMQWRQE